MGSIQNIWLVNNSASGSNDERALTEFESACDECGLVLSRRTTFPDQELPTPAALAEAGIDTVVIFAGDGTINTALGKLEGWDGAVLVLPGGTMNLLYHRLFGDMDVADALGALAAGELERRRPGVIESACGIAYAGLLAGPATDWNDVREAMREYAVLDIATEARKAIARTLDGDRIAVIEPALGVPEGYPLLVLNPTDDAITVSAYHSETTLEYLAQAWALMLRDFRRGPHEELGADQRLVLSCPEAGNFGVLVDGEPAHATGPTEFKLVKSGVDLLAPRTHAD